MLLEMALCDSYGAGFEMRPGEFVEQYNKVDHYYPHGLANKGSSGGYYTDDTQQTIAICHVLLSEKDKILAGVSIPPIVWADAFVRVFKQDPRIGYSIKLQEILERSAVIDGQTLLEAIGENNRSTKCGAAMRSLPLGVLPDEDLIRQVAYSQADVTHSSQEGRTTSYVVGLLAHYYIYGLGKTKDLPTYLNRYCDGYEWGAIHYGPVPTDGYPVVRAAINAIMEGADIRDVLFKAVRFTGDVDSVAAIACGAASSADDIPGFLPEFLYTEFEPGKPDYGEKFLGQLEWRLCSAYGLLPGLKAKKSRT